MKSKKDRSKVFSKITTISKSINSPYATLPRKFNNNFNNSNQSPFVELPNPTFAIEYKKGYIRRKCCYDSNGRKTSLGKRSWKLFYATLRDLVLYLHKDENGFRKPHVQENFTNSIRIHHSIASVANDYPKKKFVFRLITANYAEYLFETSDSKELQSWIDTINTTAASLSAPTLPMAVSSDDRKFKKEIFPWDQLNDQENKLNSLQKDLETLLEKSGNKKKFFPKGFLEKETYLQHEIKRYRVYISCLKRKMPEQMHEMQQTSRKNSGPIRRSRNDSLNGLTFDESTNQS
ncbi:PH domain-containing protein 4 [Sarcoptes scabiei]|uniref:PH domain-containing protein 4 n=1 Tax=Sarcoptes scabiei TaxID=52283 RepID=A0A132A970_SARSC|nr:PH domain-containing protein 4 [Sarcoptes scabiei]